MRGSCVCAAKLHEITLRRRLQMLEEAVEIERRQMMYAGVGESAARVQARTTVR
jgi:hypothetical protein